MVSLYTAFTKKVHTRQLAVLIDRILGGRCGIACHRVCMAGAYAARGVDVAACHRVCLAGAYAAVGRVN